MLKAYGVWQLKKDFTIVLFRNMYMIYMQSYHIN